MQNIPARKHPFLARFQTLVDDRAVRYAVDLNSRGARKLVLRNQADRQKQRVAGIPFLGSRDRAAVRADLRDRHSLHALFTFNVDDRVRQLQRDTEVVKALHDIPLQAARVRHEFGNDFDFGSLERHTPRHDQTDVAGAQDHDFMAGHVAFHVDKALRRARGENACRPVAGNVQRASGAFTAAHRKDNCPRADLE